MRGPKDAYFLGVQFTSRGRLMRSVHETWTTSSCRKITNWGILFHDQQIITDELYRNVTLSLICVLITVFFLLFNLRVCIFCGICVIFTVIDLGGIMYYWGMTIDTISLVANVVAIGLCVG